MLNPRNDRLDYGALLAPPAGYQLEFAVGTTYSLDLNALTTAILALGSGEAMDSTLKDNPICLLEAMLKITDKVALFCQQGQIHLPSKVSKLYPLLDRCVFPIHMENGCSFHPKCWLLHYTPIQKDKVAQEDKKEDLDNQDKYRFIVLSRNLTWDRSWDVSFAIEGAPVPSGPLQEKNAPLQNFLHWLGQNTPNRQNQCCSDKQKKLDELADRLNRVKFSLQTKRKGPDQPFYDFEFLPVGITDKSDTTDDILETLGFEKYYNELLVMSPFLSEDIVTKMLRKKSDNLYPPPSRMVLFTRRSELPKIKNLKWKRVQNQNQGQGLNQNQDQTQEKKEQDPSGDQIYVLKDTALYGDDAPSEGETDQVVYTGQDIHAKLFMMRKRRGGTTLYLGSLNATRRAINGNVEFMIKLSACHNDLNIAKLKEELGCTDSDTAPFMEVLPDHLPDREMSSGEDDSRLIKRVLDLGLRADVAVAENGLYRQQISYAKPGPLKELDGWTVTVRPLQASESSTVRLTEDSSTLSFLLSRTALSEFFVITIRKDTDDPAVQVISRVVVIPTTGIPEAERQNEIVRSIISTKDSFYQYVAYLLGDDKMLSALEAGLLSADESGDEHAGSEKNAPKVPGLYEKMLKTAATAPDRIDRIQKLTDAIQDDKVIPEEFEKLYRAFKDAGVVDNG